VSVTEQDRERAVQAIDPSNRQGPTWDALVEAIAAAIADERERARAPFLALASDYEELSGREDLADSHRATCRTVADRIRRAAEVSE
jgi:hypothetical protein